MRYICFCHLFHISAKVSKLLMACSSMLKYPEEGGSASLEMKADIIYKWPANCHGVLIGLKK